MSRTYRRPDRRKWRGGIIDDVFDKVYDKDCIRIFKPGWRVLGDMEIEDYDDVPGKKRGKASRIAGKRVIKKDLESYIDKGDL